MHATATLVSFRSISLPHRDALGPLSSFCSIPRSSQPLTTTGLSPSLRVPLFWGAHGKSIRRYGTLCIQPLSLGVTCLWFSHVAACVCQNPVPFHGRIIFRHTDRPQLCVPPPAGGHLGRFPLVMAVTSAAANSHVFVAEPLFPLLRGASPQVKLLGWATSPGWLFCWAAKRFPTVADPFYAPARSI